MLTPNERDYILHLQVQNKKLREALQMAVDCIENTLIHDYIESSDCIDFLSGTKERCEKTLKETQP